MILSLINGLIPYINYTKEEKKEEMCDYRKNQKCDIL